MGRKGYKALIVGLSFFASCVKDKPASPGSAPAPGAAADVYVICEGVYGSGNASLYAYNPAKDSVYGDLYLAVNNQALGDVFQSMIRIGENFFLCINHSDKIVVINVASKVKVAEIPVAEPRYVLPVSSNKAYVSSLYRNKLYVINTQSLAVTDSVALPNQNAEGMCMVNNNVAVCTWDTTSDEIFMIDAATDKLVQTIRVSGYAPQSVLLDKEQMLWVLAGNQPEGKMATLTRIDPSTGDMLASYHFPAAADPIKPVFNRTKDTLYFIEANYDLLATDNGIYRLGIHDAALPTTALIPAGANQYFYALGIDPATGYLYVGDPKGFVQKGSVYLYTPDGSKVGGFNVGLGPGGFYFDE